MSASKGQKFAERPSKAQLLERRVRALDLKVTGFLPREIVAAVKKELNLASYTVDQYYNDIQEATKSSCQRSKQEQEDLIELELVRLDYLYRRLIPKVLKDDVRAITAALKIIQARAAMLGLNAPIRTQVEAGVELELTQALAAIRSILPDDQYRKVVLAISTKAA
jgi:hypothetical protein